MDIFFEKGLQYFIQLIPYLYLTEDIFFKHEHILITPICIPGYMD